MNHTYKRDAVERLCLLQRVLSDGEGRVHVCVYGRELYIAVGGTCLLKAMRRRTDGGRKVVVMQEVVTEVLFCSTCRLPQRHMRVSKSQEEILTLLGDTHQCMFTQICVESVNATEIATVREVSGGEEKGGKAYYASHLTRAYIIILTDFKNRIS